MMKWMLIIESKINQLLTHLIHKITDLFWKLVPLNFFKHLMAKLLDWKNAKSQDQGEKEKKSLKLVIMDTIFTIKKLISQYPAWAKKTMAMIAELSQKNLIKTTIESYFLKLKNYRQQILNRILQWWNSISQMTIVFFIGGIIIISCCSWIIYHNLFDIYDQIYPNNNKEISSDYSSFKRKPYYKVSDRQMVIENLKMQVFVENVNSIKSLVVDFTLESSNRYIKAFFQKNDFYLQDQINKTLEPSIPEFPLTLEGKRIIRKKIIDECNLLLKDLKIDGHFTEVYFHTVIAG